MKKEMFPRSQQAAHLNSFSIPVMNRGCRKNVATNKVCR